MGACDHFDGTCRAIGEPGTVEFEEFESFGQTEEIVAKDEEIVTVGL